MEKEQEQQEKDKKKKKKKKKLEVLHSVPVEEIEINEDSKTKIILE